MAWIAEISLVVGTLSVILAIVLARVWDHYWLRDRRPEEWGLQSTVFLFKDKQLIDATLPARSLLNHVRAPISEWQRLLSWLELRFASISWELERTDRPPKVELTAKRLEGAMHLRLVIETMDDGLVRIELFDTNSANQNAATESVSLRAVASELDLLRDALDHTPTLIWREDPERQITWANASYMEQAEKMYGAQIGWPLPRLMEPPDLAPESGLTASRAKLEIDGEGRWYDCHRHTVGDQIVVYALPADAAVRAERNLRDFVQTLTRSFSSLHVGIALFDQSRNLLLFNPALIDMTGLPVDLLTMRPTLADFFDQLREQRVLPEPKDYTSWRSQISNANAEAEAELRDSKEEWSLADGRILRVCGSSLADGAVLFSFEDITEDVAAARGAKAGQLQSESIIDGVHDAIALIGPGPQIVKTNAAFDHQWGQGLDHIDKLSLLCAERFSLGAAVDEFRAALASTDTDSFLSGHLIDLTGQGHFWRLTPIGPEQRLLQLTVLEHLTAPADASLSVQSAEGHYGAICG